MVQRYFPPIVFASLFLTSVLPPPLFSLYYSLFDALCVCIFFELEYLRLFIFAFCILFHYLRAFVPESPVPRRARDDEDVSNGRFRFCVFVCTVLTIRKTDTMGGIDKRRVLLFWVIKIHTWISHEASKTLERTFTKVISGLLWFFSQSSRLHQVDIRAS